MSSGYVQLFERSDYKNNLKKVFLDRYKKGYLTKEENPEDHFAVFFMAFDSLLRKVLIGDHKKSGLYLPNGGHIDKSESPDQTLEREFGEELGLDVNNYQVCARTYLTITDIENQDKQNCKKHYDIWYFVSVDSINFEYNPVLTLKEFNSMRWIAADSVGELRTSNAVLEAVDFLHNEIF